MKKGKFLALGLIALMLFGGLIIAACDGGKGGACCTAEMWASLDIFDPDATLPDCCIETLVNFLSVVMDENFEWESIGDEEAFLKGLLDCCYNPMKQAGTLD